ncbi:MAG: 1-deoxy-D-xylulose-5-phosphate synthase, partial [Proteobacteria bacterium]|nr:1-deoxy-D-xylulose-5-phosphate synthase [Pseudomonadota bacterium]
NNVIAVIGDGAMSAGMAYEAMNNAGALKSKLIVVLNDNDMSIAKPVGAMSKYLAKLLSGKLYFSFRETVKMVISAFSKRFSAKAGKAEDLLRSAVTGGTLFSSLGFYYIGPIDGHDLPTLLSTLRNIRELKGPQFLHIITKKGKGYAPAEAEPIKYHGVTAFDPAKGIVPSGKSSAPTYSKIFGDWICDMSEIDKRVVAITPAMREGSGLVEYEKRFPDRYFDVGIAEQHSVTVAAGMACEGLRPVVAIYSTFLQRAYDQLIHDVIVQNLPVLFAIDRAGCVGADGPTHNGCYDITFMRCLPNIVIMTPADENECRQMLYTGIQIDGPASVRYPRGGGPGVEVEKEMTALPIGQAEIKTQGKRIAILAFGVVLEFAQAAGDAFGATVVNMRFVKPIDESMILKMAASHELIVTVEENMIRGGAGEAVNQVLAENGVTQSIVNYGLPDRLIQHGSRDDMLNDVGMNQEGLIDFIQHHIGESGQKVKIKSV